MLQEVLEKYIYNKTFNDHDIIYTYIQFFLCFPISLFFPQLSIYKTATDWGGHGHGFLDHFD